MVSHKQIKEGIIIMHNKLHQFLLNSRNHLIFKIS